MITVEEEAAVGEDARIDARGNGVADTAADQGCQRDEAPLKWLSDMVAREVADVQAVIFYAASVLPLWPRAAKEELRAARPPRGARRKRLASSQHSWAHLGERWHCRRCAASAFSPEALRRREGEEGRRQVLRV